MKLIIFGASGFTGKLLTEQALGNGHEVTAFVRREGALSIHHPNLRVVIGQLSDASLIRETVKGADACLSTMGGRSLSRHAYDIRDGIGNIVDAMEQAGVKRIIYLSSVGAGDSRYYMGPLLRLFFVGIYLRVPLADHTANEKRIMKSSLAWTLVRPMWLTDGPLTGTARHGSEFIKLTGASKVSRADLAAFMLREAENPSYLNKAAWLI